MLDNKPSNLTHKQILMLKEAGFKIFFADDMSFRKAVWRHGKRNAITVSYCWGIYIRSPFMQLGYGDSDAREYLKNIPKLQEDIKKIIDNFNKLTEGTDIKSSTHWNGVRLRRGSSKLTVNPSFNYDNDKGERVPDGIELNCSNANHIKTLEDLKAFVELIEKNKDYFFKKGD